MSKVVVALLLTAAAAAVGASAGLALKPAAKPQQAPQPQQPKPQQAVGSCPACPLPPGATLLQRAQGCVPQGAGVPPALAGRCWVSSGGNLGPWWGFDAVKQTVVKNTPPSPPFYSIAANQILPDQPPSAIIWYFPDPSPTGPVWYTVGSPDTN